MDINLIALAIPVFFAMIGVEILIARWQGQTVYRFNDAITDLSCGIGQQVTGVFMKTAVFAGYLWLYGHARLFDLPEHHWAVWVLGALGVDFAYYGWHRASHRINFVWATHVPHHQSQDYNLAVALRQAWFSRVTSAPFHWPLALIGLPPVVFLVNDSLNTLYQFWIHTETVQKLGPLEWVLNTPSHHRVHHAVNPRYVDKNYAGVLIVWDRAFGTFEEEREPACYGTVKRYRSWNPIWANFEYWGYLLDEARAATSWRDRLRIFVAPPEWRPAYRPALPQPVEVSRDTFEKWQTPVGPGLTVYVTAHFVLIAVAVTTMLFIEDQATWAVLGTLGLPVLWTTVTWGALFEGRAWGVASEGARLGVLGVLIAVWGLHDPSGLPFAVGLLVVTVLSALWLLRFGPGWSFAATRAPAMT